MNAVTETPAHRGPAYPLHESLDYAVACIGGTIGVFAKVESGAYVALGKALIASVDYSSAVENFVVTLWRYPPRTTYDGMVRALRRNGFTEVGLTDGR